MLSVCFAFFQTKSDDVQRRNLMKVMEKLTEAEKQINKLKIKDKEKIKKLEELLKIVREAIHPLVNITSLIFWNEKPQPGKINQPPSITSCNESVNWPHIRRRNQGGSAQRIADKLENTKITISLNP